MNNYTWNIKNIESKISELRKRTESDNLHNLDIITLNAMLSNILMIVI